jgi:exonuclease SbcD
MRILHTSDWHLGQHFMGKSRQAEHQALIDWLLTQVEEHAVDAVLIAGDIFDTGSPPSYARELYSQLVVRPVADAPTLQANLVHLRFEPLSQLAQAFVSQLKQLVQQQGFGASSG